MLCHYLIDLFGLDPYSDPAFVELQSQVEFRLFDVDEACQQLDWALISSYALLLTLFTCYHCCCRSSQTHTLRRIKHLQDKFDTQSKLLTHTQSQLAQATTQIQQQLQQQQLNSNRKRSAAKTGELIVTDESHEPISSTKGSAAALRAQRVKSQAEMQEINELLLTSETVDAEPLSPQLVTMIDALSFENVMEEVNIAFEKQSSSTTATTAAKYASPQPLNYNKSPKLLPVVEEETKAQRELEMALEKARSRQWKHDDLEKKSQQKRENDEQQLKIAVTVAQLVKRFESIAQIQSTNSTRSSINSPNSEANAPPMTVEEMSKYVQRLTNAVTTILQQQATEQRHKKNNNNSKTDKTDQTQVKQEK